jgi:hypothetical protein
MSDENIEAFMTKFGIDYRMLQISEIIRQSWEERGKNYLAIYVEVNPNESFFKESIFECEHIFEFGVNVMNRLFENKLPLEEDRFKLISAMLHQLANSVYSLGVKPSDWKPNNWDVI